MEKMLVVVFDNEPKAYQGLRALNRLDAEGSITIHAESVLRKDSNGKVSEVQAAGDFPIRAVGGTAIGSLIGLLGGPVGLGIGAVTGALAGTLGDLYVAGVDAEFVDDTAANFVPGKCAVVADLNEEWITPVDSRMEELGGVVFRALRTDIEDEQRARDVAELKREIAEFKGEQAQAHAKRKAKLQAQIDTLNTKLQQKLDQANQRLAQIKSETDAKVQALRKKAAKAQGEQRAAFESRIAQIQGQYEQRSTHLKHLAAEQLRKAATRLEQ